MLNDHINLPVVYQDEDIIVINKPSGLLSVPGKGPDLIDSVATRVQSHFTSAGIVHRLDRDTSGIIVMALNPDAQRHINLQFQKSRITKTYIAILAGRVKQDADTIDLPIRKDMTISLPPMHLVDYEHGKPSITKYNVLERRIDSTRLELHPITGRSHQLRLHLKSIGHPILGDDIYAPDEIKEAASRLCLHAQTIQFRHPEDGRHLHFHLPPDF